MCTIFGFRSQLPSIIITCPLIFTFANRPIAVQSAPIVESNCLDILDFSNLAHKQYSIAVFVQMIDSQICQHRIECHFDQ